MTRYKVRGMTDAGGGTRSGIVGRLSVCGNGRRILKITLDNGAKIGYRIYMAKTKGSKTTKEDAYEGRSLRVKKKFGVDAYHRWGKLGGNPVLLKGRK